MRRRAALALGLLGIAAAARSGPAPRGGLLLDEPGRIPSAPLFAAVLHDLDHKTTLLGRSGRPMLVNFWARWCGPCKVEIPELAALHARRAGIDVIGIALENDGAAVRDFARAYDMEYRLLLARDGSGLDLMRSLGNPTAGLPFTLALDRQGRIVARRLGLLTREQLDQAVQRALG